MKRRVLVVEDEPKTNETIRLYFEKAGYEVMCAFDGIEALRVARDSPPDLVVLDLMLPGLNGYDVCRGLRRERPVPVIMVTARSTEDDKLTGLDLGADDYITKPFSPRELVARARAVLRRVNDEVHATEIRCGELVIDLVRHETSFGGKKLCLTPSEERILSVMARHPGRVFSRAELIERALGGDGEVFERTVDAHLTNIRKKLRAVDAVGLIVTVFGAGYKLLEETS